MNHYNLSISSDNMDNISFIFENRKNYIYQNKDIKEINFYKTQLAHINKEIINIYVKILNIKSRGVKWKNKHIHLQQLKNARKDVQKNIINYYNQLYYKKSITPSVLYNFHQAYNNYSD